MTLEDLQNAVGEKPIIEASNFSNWAGDVTVNNVFKAVPSSVDEIQKVVRTRKNRCAHALQLYSMHLQPK